MSQHVVQHLHDHVTTNTTLHVPCYNIYSITLQQCYNIYKLCVMEQGWVAMATLPPHKLQILHVHILGRGTIHQYYMYSHKAITKGHEFM